MRKRTGLRNKYRSGGQSPYSARHKGREADHYGVWVNGRRTSPEVVAGRTLSYAERVS